MYNLEGKKENNIISLDDGNYLNEIKISKNLIILSRHNKEVSYCCYFDIQNKTVYKYNIKEHNSYINVEVKTHNIKIEKNRIKVEYTQNVEGNINNYEYILEWEEV